ncbi:MAG: PEP-CTERM sorting domain-containing protein, partial [Patescibacteria group bacterium]|nr:PEP-CTERM sorting domain-containing protein [Patescibacteria group bacterium]
TNNTGSDWLNGYCIQLGYGLGDDFVLATDGLSFATNAPLGLAGGETQAVYPYPVAIGADITASFPINMGDSNVFTIRQFAVPEPGSLGLLAFCGLALLALRRRR